MSKLDQIECPSGLFLLVKNFEKENQTAVDTSAHLLDFPALQEWFEKGAIEPSDRLFCIDHELEIQEEVTTRRILLSKGKKVMESVV